MECWKLGTYAWVFTLSSTLGGRHPQHDLLMTIEKLCVLRTQLEDLLTRSSNDLEKNRVTIISARKRGESVRSVLIVKLLKRSLMLKKERIDITNKMATVELQISALESSDFNHNMLTTMQKSADTMRKMGLEKGLQLADTTISQLEENIHVAGEMQQALGMSISDNHLNDDELDAELEEIMCENGDYYQPHKTRVIPMTLPPVSVKSSMRPMEQEETTSRASQDMVVEVVPV
jgi:Snf7